MQDMPAGTMKAAGAAIRRTAMRVAMPEPAREVGTVVGVSNAGLTRELTATLRKHGHFHGRSLEAALTVSDLEVSLAWYRDVVGFTIDHRYEREGNLIAIALKAGEVRILIVQDDGAKGMDRSKGEGLSLQITTPQSIDELARCIKERGGTLALEPTTVPWGPRMFRLQDPDGFKFTISSGTPARADAQATRERDKTERE